MGIPKPPVKPPKQTAAQIRRKTAEKLLAVCLPDLQYAAVIEKKDIISVELSKAIVTVHAHGVPNGFVYNVGDIETAQYLYEQIMLDIYDLKPKALK